VYFFIILSPLIIISIKASCKDFQAIAFYIKDSMLENKKKLQYIKMYCKLYLK